jgi:hypothetical protein
MMNVGRPELVGTRIIEQYLAPLWQKDHSDPVVRLYTFRKFQPVSTGSTDIEDQIVFFALKMEDLPLS